MLSTIPATLAPGSDPSQPSGGPNPEFAKTEVTCGTVEEQQTPACTAEALAPKDVVYLSEDGNTKYKLGPVRVTGDMISKATAVLRTASGTSGGESGWVVSFQLTSKGSDTFGAVTKELLGKQLAIVLDQQVLSAPTIQSQITGSGEITGNFTEQRAKDLATSLNAGALPVNLAKSQVETVSATLGKASLKQGLIAGLAGLILLALYLAFYYRLLGLVAWLGMAIWAILALGVVSFLGRVAGYSLTLAGVAGLVVSIGITADSYIVFYERLKDDVRHGKTPRAAVQPAFRRAWRTIVAADIVTLLAAAVLYLVAISSVRGFALTLGVSVLLDLFVVYFYKRPTVFLMARSKTLLTRSRMGLSAEADEEDSSSGAVGAPSPAPAGGGR
jgi:preprotein translocase subunit SecD